MWGELCSTSFLRAYGGMCLSDLGQMTVCVRVCLLLRKMSVFKEKKVTYIVRMCEGIVEIKGDNGAAGYKGVAG